MRKKFFGGVLAAVLTLAVTATVFASEGSWDNDGFGRKYQYADGSYAAANTWIYDNNGNWYHIGEDGYRQSGEAKINDYTYTFDEGGIMTADNVNQDYVDYEFPEAINAKRKAAGLSELTLNSELQAEAETRIPELETMFSAKERPNGQAAFPNELILTGNNTAYAVVDAWLGSPQNKAKLLNPDFTNMGISERQGTNGRLYWILILE
jgi:hypothetical protein